VQANGIQLVWHREYNVVMLNGQGVLHQVVNPECLFCSLAFRTMPVAAAIVTVTNHTAVFASFFVPAKEQRSALAILPSTLVCSGVSFVLATSPAPNKPTASASSNLARIAFIVIQRIQRTVGLYQRALCHVQVNHGGGNVGMAKQLFEGYDIKPLFQQMCGIRVAQRMQVYILCDGSFFEVFAYHPRKPAHAVTAIGFFPVK
jgi:hypothetical protein